MLEIHGNLWICEKPNLNLLNSGWQNCDLKKSSKFLYLPNHTANNPKSTNVHYNLQGKFGLSMMCIPRNKIKSLETLPMCSRNVGPDILLSQG